LQIMAKRATKAKKDLLNKLPIVKN
jgi:hypothetical protein